MTTIDTATSATPATLQRVFFYSAIHLGGDGANYLGSAEVTSAEEALVVFRARIRRDDYPVIFEFAGQRYYAGRSRSRPPHTPLWSLLGLGEMMPRFLEAEARGDILPEPSREEVEIAFLRHQRLYPHEEIWRNGRRIAKEKTQ